MHDDKALMAELMDKSGWVEEEISPVEPVTKVAAKIKVGSRPKDDESPVGFKSHKIDPALFSDDPTVVATGVDATEEIAWAVHTTKATDITPMVKRWLWPKRFVANDVNLATGKGDCGKSFVLIDVVRCVTTGCDWPDGEKNEMGPRSVLMICSEDNREDTIVPRLMASGADLSKIEFLDGISVAKANESLRKQKLTLKEDMHKIEAVLKKRTDFALIAFDPISGNLGVAKDNDNTEVRLVLESLHRMLGRTKVSLIGIIHHNKASDQDAVQKILGAGAWGHVARMIWAFCRDKEDKLLYYMAKAKGNAAKVVIGKSGLKYRIEDRTVQVNEEQPDGSLKLVDSTQGYVEWHGDHDMDADGLTQHFKDVADGKIMTADEDSQYGRAREFLETELAGGRQMGRDVHRKREAVNLSEPTVRRAFKTMGGRYVNNDGTAWVRGSKAPVYWELPADDADPVVREHEFKADGVSDEVL